MSRGRSFLPSGLAGRIALLLAVALLCANVIAIGVVRFQVQRFQSLAIDDRLVERISALVLAIEAVEEPARSRIAGRSPSPFIRVSLERAPMANLLASDVRSAYIKEQLTDTLSRPGIEVGTQGRERRRFRRRRSQILQISVPMATSEPGPEWLNIAVQTSPRIEGRSNAALALSILAASLLAVMIVALYIGRHLTIPLQALSDAAQKAGRGDRFARVPEEGPREMREAAKAFNAMQAEIATFDAERMRMLAAVGHDLRTPMTALRIRAEMIDDPQLREPMIRILEEMSVMADGLVTYAREGHDTEATAPVRLDQLIAEICGDRQATFDAAEAITISGQRVSLGRALGNLVDNALRYGKSAHVALRLVSGQAVITIEDAGPGIPPDLREEMYRPFVRGEQSRNLETGGSGLGLSIARTIILAHSGSIEMQNLSPAGLRVTIRLPGAYLTR